MQTFTTIYRTGGTENVQWHRCLAVTSREEAQAQQTMIQRGGRKALVHKTAELDAIGMPVGWEA